MRTAVPAMIGVVAVLAATIAAACGGDASPTGTNATEPAAHDLSQMVLQQQDVPSGFVRVDVDGQVDNDAESGIEAGLIAFLLTAEGINVRFSQFELPPDRESAGEIICITSFVAVAEDQDQAGLALFNFAEVIGTSEDTPVVRKGDAEIELLDSAWRFQSTHEDLCRRYKGQPAEGCVVPVLRENVVGFVFVAVSQAGADCNAAAAFGRKQFDRIEAAVANG